jgi:hypothetical protein
MLKSFDTLWKFIYMINRSPWLWGVRKSASSMTGRTSNGIQILQGKRAKGQSNPSTEFLSNQAIARLIWPIFRAAQGLIRQLWTNVPTGAYAANEFFRVNRADAIDVSVPLVPTVEYANLVFSRGTMSSTTPLTVVADVSDNKVAVTFPTTPSDASQYGGDIVGIVIHNRDKNKWLSYTEDHGVRSDGTTGTITVNPALSMAAGDNVDIYLSFRADTFAPNYPGTSQSMYATTVAVA